jgi:hypothetical protein
MDRSPASITSSFGNVDLSFGGLDSSNSRQKSLRDQRIPLTKSIDMGGSYAGNSIVTTGIPMKKPNPTQASGLAVSPLIVLSKTVNALLLMFIGIVLGALVVTKSADWIYSVSTGTSPLITCPSRSVAFESVQVLDGDACEMRFSFTSFSSFESSVSTAFRVHNTHASGNYQCFQSDVYTDCSVGNPCHVRCYSSSSCLSSLGSGSCGDSGFNWGNDYSDTGVTTCQQTIYLSNYNYPIKDARISVQPLCGTNVNLTPSMIQTLRAELVSVGVTLMLIIGSLIIKAKRAPKSAALSSVSNQKAITIAKSSANELKALVESQWDSEYERRLQLKPQLSASSPLSSISPTGGLRVSQHLGGSLTDAVVHPAKQFASSSWKYRVRVMHAMLRKREKTVFRDCLSKTIWASFLLVTIVFASTILLLSILPQSYPGNLIITPTTSPSVFYSSIFAPLYNGGTWVSGTWVDALVLLDFTLEFIVVVVALSCGHKWSSRPSDRELWKLSNEVRASEDACLVITIPSGTCLRTKSRDRLVKLIESGLTELKFGAVFIIDMGSSSAPSDDTWRIVSRIDPVCVHYVYLPDTHKKLATYWLSQVWIPFLYRNGRVDRMYKNCMHVDFENLTSRIVDHPTLNQILTMTDDNHSSLIMLPTMCADGSDLATSWENMRLSSDYFMRKCETAFTGGLVVSTNFAEPVCVYDQSRPDWRNMNPEMSGLNIAKKRGSVSVLVSTHSKPIGAKNSSYNNYVSMGRSFTIGVSQLWEYFFSFSSYKHSQSFLLKVFLLIGPIMSMVMIVLRPFILSSLLFRDPLGLILLLLIAGFLIITTNALERVSILRGGKKNKNDKHVPYIDVIRTGSLITYPLYQTYLGFMRIGLGISGCTFGKMKDDVNRPSICNQKELYPCPPHPDIDWFSVWRTSDATRLSVLSTAIDASMRSNSLGGPGAHSGCSQESWCSSSNIV